MKPFVVKQEIEEMLENNNDIMNWKKFQTEFKNGKDSLSQFIHIFLRAVVAYEAILEHALSKLDDIDKPTDDVSF